MSMTDTSDLHMALRHPSAHQRTPQHPVSGYRQSPSTCCTVQRPLQKQGPVEANGEGRVWAMGVLRLWDSESSRIWKSYEPVGLGVCWQEEDSLQGGKSVLWAPTKRNKDPEGRPWTMSPHVSLSTKWLLHSESWRRPASFYDLQKFQ